MTHPMMLRLMRWFGTPERPKAAQFRVTGNATLDIGKLTRRDGVTFDVSETARVRIEDVDIRTR